MKEQNVPVKWAAASGPESKQELPAAPLERMVGQESSLDQQEGISKRRNFLGGIIAGVLGLFGLNKTAQAKPELPLGLNDLRVKEFSRPTSQSNAFYTTGFNCYLDFKNPEFYPEAIQVSTMDIADVGLLYWCYHSSDELKALIKRAIEDGQVVIKKDNGEVKMTRAIWKMNLIGGEYHVQSSREFQSERTLC